MADKKISELPDATLPIGAGVKFEAVQGGVNVKVDATDMPGSGGTGTVESVTGDGVDNTDPDNPVLTFPDASEVAFTPAGNISATDVQAALEEVDTEKAPLASPALTGVPTAPTAAPTTNTTQIATTAFVQAALSAAKSMVISVTDEVTNISTGTAKVSFRMPYAMTLTAVRASLNVAQASGSIFTVDINEAGSSILSTKLTIDNTELTSTTAATPAVISDANLADDALITIDVDQIGNGSAIGLKVTLIGT